MSLVFHSTTLAAILSSFNVTDDASVSLGSASASKAEGISDLGLGGGDVRLISKDTTRQATLTAAVGPAGWNVSNEGQAVAVTLIGPVLADVLTGGLSADMLTGGPQLAAC